MPVFLEKFLLPLAVALVVLIAGTNPMRFDWTQRITGSLHKQNGSGEFPKNFISQLFRITSSAQRITQANQRVHVFLE